MRLTRTARPASLRSLLAVALAAAGAGPVHAANTGYARAERHAAEARLSLYAGDAAAAGRSYELAYAAQPNPAFLLDAGAAYARGGDHASAQRVYQRALELGLEGSPGQRARQGLEDSLAKLQKSRARVAITVFPATATVTVDGSPVEVGPTGGVAWVEPGRHTIEARAQGFEPAERAVEVPVGDAVEVKLSLAPIAGAALLMVGANVPGATVKVNGRAVGVTPLEAISLEEGTAEVRLEKPGYEPWARSVTVRRGEPTRVEANLVTAVTATASTAATAVATEVEIEDGGSSGDDGMIIGGWVSLGAGLGAVGAGVAMHLLSVDSQNQANTLSNEPEPGSGVDPTQYYNEYYVPEYNRLVDDASQKQLIAFILDGAGGALVVTGVVLLALGYTADASTADAGSDGPTLTGFGLSPVPGGSVLTSGFSF